MDKHIRSTALETHDRGRPYATQAVVINCLSLCVGVIIVAWSWTKTPADSPWPYFVALTTTILAMLGCDFISSRLFRRADEITRADNCAAESAAMVSNDGKEEAGVS